MSASVILPSESTLQQIWRYQIWQSPNTLTVDGEKVAIISPGKYNNGKGPDFSEARIRIDGQEWVGSVEIHVRAGDWYRHGHDRDNAYDNVILHVVAWDDAVIYRRTDGGVIPQIVINVNPAFNDTFNYLLHGKRYVLPHCGQYITSLENIIKTDWITALAFERLQRKADDIRQRLAFNNGDWCQTTFVTLARGLGFGTNAQTMEMVARSIPFRVMLKHADNPETIEALLLGQAGLLNHASPHDLYEKQLCTEHKFYAHKYGLIPVPNAVWQTSSRNGYNTPHRRLALLARITAMHSIDLGINLCESTAAGASRELFDVELNYYWTTHATFGRNITTRPYAIGRQTTDLLTINVLAPLVYHRGEQTGRDDLQDAAIEMLEHTKPENNSIVRGFNEYNFKAPDAFTSQALVQLHREYCENGRCLECRLGYRILSNHISMAGQCGIYGKTV